jgi:thiol-disulfide isomerase/thioredoxin
MPPQSGQYTTKNKGDIFTPVNPMEGVPVTDEHKSIQEAMTSEVDKRMRNAVEDLQVKYATGDSNEETSEHGPSGGAYRLKQHAQDQARRKKRVAQGLANHQRAEEVRRQATERILDEEGVGESSDDDEYLDGLEDDGDILQTLRNKRLAQMKAQHATKIENLQKGHGRYHEICQDDFLTDVLKSKNTLVHFYHSDFENCKVIDHHLSVLAPRHVECKFMKMDADKSPFFIQKLQVQVMPTVVVFRDGLAVARLVGFDGLTEGLKEGHFNEFKTEALEGWLAKAGCIEYEATATEAEIEKHTLAGQRRAMMVGYADGDDGIEQDAEAETLVQ